MQLWATYKIYVPIQDISILDKFNNNIMLISSCIETSSHYINRSPALEVTVTTFENVVIGYCNFLKNHAWS